MPYHREFLKESVSQVNFYRDQQGFCRGGWEAMWGKGPGLNCLGDTRFNNVP